jgi:hypothetical protein
VRNDKANLALDVGTGLDIGLSSKFALTTSLSWVFSNATLTPATEPKLDQGIYAALGISVSTGR